MGTTKEVYCKYYNGANTGIGGNDRFKWVNEVLLKDLAGKTVLDVGCGEGSLLEMIRQKNNSVFGLDASETGKRSCEEKGIKCQVVDISNENFPYSDDMFDVVLCLETLEHIENPHFCIYEIKRVLKEGGVFITSVPNPVILHPYIYPGLFETDNFIKFLELCSFDIKEMRGWGQACILIKFSRWLKTKNNPIASFAEGLIHYVSRKRNLIMRKYTGTPLKCSYTLNFVCVNHKSDKTLVERVAEETLPEPAKTRNS